MKNKEFYIQKLVEINGEPDSDNYLNNYIDFVLEEKEIIPEAYYENHHILVRADFPEFIHEDWNIVRLKYEDHVKAHELLAKAFNNRKYLRTLNFMNSKIIKDSNIISNAAKRGWQKLKSNKEKFDLFKLKRSMHMKTLSHEENSRRAKKGWASTDYDLRCKINKEIWTESLKAKKSYEMKNFFKENPNESKRRLKKRWDNISPEEKKLFDDKMKIVNNLEYKKEKARKKMKSLWEKEDFKEKMKTRKKRGSGVGKYVCISPNSEIYEFNNLKDLDVIMGFNIYLVRKFLNTSKPVKSYKQQNNPRNLKTEGWIFYTEKEYLENGKS